MTRPRTIVCGQGEAAGRIEYLKSRRMLRLTGGSSTEGRELTVGAFCNELGIDGTLSPPMYMLFAGTGAPAGGCRDLVATYACAEQARREFVTRRRASAYQWAELISVADGRMAAMCWFGVDRMNRTLSTPSAVTAPRPRRRWLRSRLPQSRSRA